MTPPLRILLLVKGICMTKKLFKTLIWLSVLFSSLAYSQEKLTDIEILNQTSANDLNGCMERLNYYKVIVVSDSFEHYLLKAKALDQSHQRLDLISELLKYYYSTKHQADSVDYYLEVLSAKQKAQVELKNEASLIKLKFYSNYYMNDSVDAMLKRLFEQADTEKDVEFLLKLWPIKVLNLIRTNGLNTAKSELFLFIDFLNRQTPSQATIDAHIVITKFFAYHFRIYPKAVLHSYIAENQAIEINEKEKLYSINYLQSNLYDNIGDLNKALFYQRKVLKALYRPRFAHELANIYNSIGWSHLNMGELDSAANYFQKSLRVYQDYAPLDSRIAFPLSNLGIVNYRLGDFLTAISILDSAEKKWNIIANDGSKNIGQNEVNAYTGLSLLGLSKFEPAEKLLLRTLQDCQAMKDFSNHKEVLKGLIELYSLTGKYERANDYFRQYVALSELTDDLKSSKEISDLEVNLLKDDYEKTISTLSEAEKLKGIIIEEQNRIIALVISVLVAFGVLTLVLVFFTNKIKRAKEKIETQSETIFNQNAEILDSINCANRIQSSLISMGYSALETDFNSFLYYKPKDIVGGDFIWSKRFDRSSYIVLGDCTGHGVSGAMLGMMAISFLEDLLKSDTLSPVELARELKAKVVQLFSQKQHEVLSEGMDIAILKIDKNKGLVEYTGANIPLFFIRNNELKIIAPTKTSISVSQHESFFEMVEIEVNEGDRFFMMSDGIRDQFGGPSDKKLTTKRVKNIILDSSNQELSKQKMIVIDQVESWKGLNEQTDDMCLVGIEI